MFVSCKEETLKRVGSFDSMGTRIIVQPESALSVVQETFLSVDAQLSEWKQSSSLSAVNASAGIAPVQCSQGVCVAVEQALELAKSTDGAFDPTWACLWELWNFESGQLPEAEEITKLLPQVDWEQVEIVEHTIFLRQKGMMLGLGGIAKGTALNQAREALLRNGVGNFMMIAGGQVAVQGSKRTIGIRNPDGLPNDIIATVELKNASISTSGDYEKYFEKEGVRYHHILNPRTGFPVQNSVRSVSVISTDAAVADAYSTALFVMGVEEGIALVEQTEDLEVLFIEDGNVMTKSSGFMYSLIASKTYP